VRGIAQGYPPRPKAEPRSGRGCGRRLRVESLFLLADFGRDERGGDEGLRERAGDMSQKRGGNAAKMKFASGLTTQIFVPWLI